jgi:flagellar hook-associated protein 1 FlgK
MSVTAHNIANAHTRGYSRQRVELGTAGTFVGSQGWLQRGVVAENVTRSRDRFLDASYRREAGLFGGASTMRRFLEQIEVSVQEPSETGVAAALDAFFHAFADLANDPTSEISRELVRTAAESFIERVHAIDSQLREAGQSALERMRSEVAEVNAIARHLAEVNTEIQNAGGASKVSGDLLDQRDLLLDRISSFVGVRVLEQEDGTVGVMAGDVLLVDGATARELAVVELPEGTVGVTVDGSEMPIELGAGSLAALEELFNTQLPKFEEQLDAFVKAVVTEVNSIHRNGYGLDGQTGIDFFDPGGLTAGSIALSETVAESPRAIAAGSLPEAGDNEVALQIAGLAHTGVDSVEGRTLRSLYTDFSILVGNAVRGAQQEETTHQTLMDQADVMRLSVSGVSVDEEMINLITQQEAYAAAARLIRVADEMIQEVLRLI